jgi:hypothetical protein
MQDPLEELRHLSEEEQAQLAEYACAIQEAQGGDPRNYVMLQWPDLILDTFQWDMLLSLFDPAIRSTWVKGNTGCGKGAASAIGICAYYDVFEDAKIVITSSSVEHALRVMFAEVAKFYKMAKYRPPGIVLAESVRDHEQHRIDVVNPEKDEGFSGAHGEHLLIVIDEATSFIDSRFALAMTQAKKLLAIGNPRTLAGVYRMAFGRIDPNRTHTAMGQHGPQRLISIPGSICMNVREKRLASPVGPPGGMEIRGRKFEYGERIPSDFYQDVKPIIPGQTAYDEYLALLNDPDPFVVKVFCKAEFPDEDPYTQLILASWLDRHCKYWGESVKAYRDGTGDIDDLLPVTVFGLDPASTLTGDATVLAAGGPKGIRCIYTRKFAKTSQVAAWAIEQIERDFGISLESGCFPISIDCDGLGRGVVDYMTDKGVAVIPIMGNSTPLYDIKKYGNRRTEIYSELAKRLSPDDLFADRPYAIPEDGLLKEELCVAEKEFIGNDGLRYRLTPKDNRGNKNIRGIKQRIGRSPDRSDAVALCHAALMEWEESQGICHQLDPSAFEPDMSWSDEESKRPQIVEDWWKPTTDKNKPIK